MKKIFDVLYYYVRNELLKHKNDIRFIKGKYAHRDLIGIDEISAKIIELINGEKPFCVARFGATELFCASSFEFSIEKFKEKSMHQLCEWSGFFPEDVNYGERFNKCLIESIQNVDILSVWNLRFEEYYINHFMKENLDLIYLADLEPWKNPDNPWSSALENKKVLVIHPFEDTILSQYKKREKIYPQTDILPSFELKTIKAVQTLAGERDVRFSTWFDALDWMYQKTLQIEYDVAIIGCGAYGLPLAAKIKKAGKKAIHLGGATQLLFGIKGRRWDELPQYQYVRDYYNEYWVYPNERISNYKKVEEGCYW